MRTTDKLLAVEILETKNIDDNNRETVYYNVRVKKPRISSAVVRKRFTYCLGSMSLNNTQLDSFFKDELIREIKQVFSR